MNLALIPFVQFREFDDNGQLLSGGKIYFYKAGTLTPQATYQDSAGTILNSNPVILDSAGSAKIFLLPAKYHVIITDANDVQIHEIDEIGSGGALDFGSGGTGTSIIVPNYSALRNLSVDYDLVFVLGRETPGDGGYGQFVKSDSVGADDDGILLVRQSTTRYMRELDGYVDPLWFGVQYDTAVDQFNELSSAIGASISYALPLVIAGNTYLQTNLTIPTNTRLVVNGSLYGPSGSPPTVTFANQAILESCSNAGLRLPIVFGVGCVRGAITSSWFGGGDDTELARISAISTGEYVVNFNKSYILSTSVSIPSNLKVDFLGGSKFTINMGGLDITINKLIYNGNSTIIDYSNVSYIAGVNLGTACRPEWFGAVGDGVADDTKAVTACAKATVMLLTGRYKITTNISTTRLTIYGSLEGALSQVAPITYAPTPALVLSGSGEFITITGAGQFAANSIGIEMTADGSIDTNGGNIALKNTVVYAPNGGTMLANWVAAQESVISNDTVLVVPVATDIYLDNCRLDNDHLKRQYRQFTQFEDVYLNKVKGASVLSTDVDGKIIGSDNLSVWDAVVTTLKVNAAFNLGSKTISASTYSILDSDPPITIFTSSSTTINVTLPASVGPNGSKFRFVCLARDSGNARNLTIDPANTWEVNGWYLGLPDNGFSIKLGSWFYFAEGKWLQA